MKCNRGIRKSTMRESERETEREQDLTEVRADKIKARDRDTIIINSKLTICEPIETNITPLKDSNVVS